MALHLFDPNRHELALANGEHVFVWPSWQGCWSQEGEQLPEVVQKWACLTGIAQRHDEVAVLNDKDASCPV